MRRARVGGADVDLVVAVLLEIIHVDAAHLGIGPVDVLGAQLAVGHFEDRVVEAHLLGQQPPHVARRLALAGRVDGLLIVREVEVAPRPHHVLGLAGHGGGQDDVGILRRVGDEVLGDDGEQVLALQALDDLVGLGRLADGIGAEDEQALDRRIELHLAVERLAEPQIVDDARAGLDPVGPRGLHPIDREVPQRQLQHAAADVAPRAGNRRNGINGASGLRAAGRALDGDADADGGWLRGGELASELGDVGRLHAGDLLDVVEREFGGACLQLRPAVRVIVDVILVDHALLDHRIDDAQGERAVGAGLGADVPVAGLGGARLVAVDDDDLGAALLRFEHERPVVQVGRDRIARPDDDVLAVHEALRDRRRPSGHASSAMPSMSRRCSRSSR